MKARLFRLAARLLPTVLLVACAGVPPMPHASLQRGESIGLLVEVADVPLHTHYGPEGRHVRPYPYSWQLDAAVTDVVRRQLGVAGFSVVDLEAQGLRGTDLTPEAVARLRQQGIRAVVRVQDAPALAANDCGSGRCEERYAEGPGLYTSSTGTVGEYAATAAFSWQVFLTDAPVDLTQAEPLRATLHMPSVPLLAFPLPADVDRLAPEQLAPVRDKVLDYVEATAEDVVMVLGGPRVIERPPQQAVAPRNPG